MINTANAESIHPTVMQCLGQAANAGKRISVIGIADGQEVVQVFQRFLSEADQNRNHAFIYLPNPLIEKRALFIEFGACNEAGFRQPTSIAFCAGPTNLAARGRMRAEPVCNESSFSSLSYKERATIQETDAILYQGMVKIEETERWEDLPEEIQNFLSSTLFSDPNLSSNCNRAFGFGEAIRSGVSEELNGNFWPIVYPRVRQHVLQHINDLHEVSKKKETAISMSYDYSKKATMDQNVAFGPNQFRKMMPRNECLYTYYRIIEIGLNQNGEASSGPAASSSSLGAASQAAQPSQAILNHMLEAARSSPLDDERPHDSGLQIIDPDCIQRMKNLLKQRIERLQEP